MIQKKEYVLAVHEAAHAVAAAAAKCRFKKVTINSDNDYAGFLETHGQQLSLQDSCLITLAGIGAESLLIKSPIEVLIDFYHKQPREGEFLNDVHAITQSLENLHPRERGPFMQWIKVRTIVSLEARWKYVLRVAERLQAKKTLTEDEVYQLLPLPKPK